MKRSQRSGMLADEDLGVAERWADVLLANPSARVSKSPAAELTNMQFRDPVHGQAFFVVEVLFQECFVEIGSARGYGYALGQDPERAPYAPFLDAGLNPGHPLNPMVDATLVAPVGGHDSQVLHVA